MAFIFASSVEETTTTTGTGTYTLSGVASSGKFTFAAKIGDGNTTSFTVTDGVNTEHCIGVLGGSGTTLTRATILSSTNSNNAVDWTAGTRRIFCTNLGERMPENNSAADKLAYFSGVATYSLTDFTAFGRNLVDDADSSAARTTLGLGTISTQNIDGITSSVAISVNSATNALRITQTGSGNSLLVEDETNPDSTPFVVTASGDVGIGTGSPSTKLDVVGSVTLTETLSIRGTATSGADIKLYEDTDNGTNYVAFKAPSAITTDVTWTLPNADGSENQVLKTNGSGILSWETITGGASITNDTTTNSTYYPTLSSVTSGTLSTAYVSNTKLTFNPSTGNLAAGGTLTGTGSIIVNGTSASSADIKLYEDTDNGTNYVAFKAPTSIASDVTWTLPSTDGSNNQVLATNGNGTLSWYSVQPLDSELTALAGLTSAADTLPYFTGSGTASTTTLTSTARNLLDDTSTSAMRTTLELGTAATASTGTSDGNVPVYASSQINMEDKTLRRSVFMDFSETKQTVAADTTTDIDIEAGNVVELTQNTNITTFNFNNPPVSGTFGSLTILRVKDDSATARSIAWPLSVDWAFGIAPTLTQTANAIDIFCFFTIDGGTRWHGVMASKDSK